MEEWPATADWFREHWLPEFEQTSRGMTGLYSNTEKKIQTAAAGVKK